MKIDAHQHFWKLSRGDYGWLQPGLNNIYKDFMPEDLRPHLKAHDIKKTIVVQAAPTIEETNFLLDLFEKTDFIAGVVGWLDMESDAFLEQFYAMCERDGFVGIRPMIHDIEDDRWVLRPKVLKHMALLVEEDFPIDILIFPRHLPYIIELMERLPTLRAVIDHCAKPYITKRQIEPWATQMEKLASYPNIMCKISGLITEADHQHWTEEDIRPYVERAVEIFGTNAVMYGSDWPVCLLAGTYSQVYNSIVHTLPKQITEKELAAIFGGNAMRFYKL